MRMTDRDGERIGFIFGRHVGHRKQDFNHLLHLRFLGAAAAHYGELDGFWAVFMHPQPTFNPGTQHSATRLTKFERRFRIAGEDELFDGHVMRLILGYQHGNPIKDNAQTIWPGLFSNPDTAAGNPLAAMPVAVDDRKTGIA